MTSIAKSSKNDSEKSNTNELIVLVQREVTFYDDELTAVRAADGQIYVGIRQMCISLGIDAQAQRRRMERHSILFEGLKVVAKLATTFGDRDTYVLRVDLVPLWLSGIRTKSVNDEVRPKLERFQREAARVLWEAFQTGELSADDTLNDLLKEDTPATQAYKMIMAMAQMARQQVLIEGRIGRNEQAIQNNTATLGDLAQRVESIEADMGRDDRVITNAQAVEIAQGVKQIALLLSKNSGMNAYGGVYGELHRRFEIPSYRQLPSARFDEAMTFLRGWWEGLTDNSNAPF